MTQESPSQTWTILFEQPTRAREVEHVLATAPHGLAQIFKRRIHASMWDPVVGHEDFAPLLLSDVPEAVLAGVAASVDEVLKEVTSLNHEVATLKGEIEGLKHDLQERGRSRLAVITELGRDDLDLRTPMTITLEEYPEEYLARVPELDLFAAADSESAAIELLKQDIGTLFEELRRAPPKKLGRAPKRWLEILSKMIRQRT